MVVNVWRLSLIVDLLVNEQFLFVRPNIWVMCIEERMIKYVFLVGAAATTVAAVATTSGVGTLAATLGAGYALSSACGGGLLPKEQPDLRFYLEALRRELEEEDTEDCEEEQQDIADN